MTADPRAVLKSYVDSMPTFSPATSKILQLTSQLNAPAAEIVAAIRLDPVLTGRVLQLVNSAYFSLAQRVTSLNRALVYLGINTIKNLALSTAVMDVMDAKDAAVADLIQPTWRHSLAAAVCAKNLAKASGVPGQQIEEYFIAGLLHRLGQIILMQAFYSSDPYLRGYTLAQERERYGLDHTGACAETLRRWKFSEEFVEGASNYLEPKSALSRFVCIANLMAERLAAAPAEKPAPFPQNVLEELRLTPAQVEAELASAPEQIEKAEIFLNITRTKPLKEEP